MPQDVVDASSRPFAPAVALLAREPTAAERVSLALYDAPGFVPRHEAPSPLLLDLGHAGRMAGAGLLCAGAWAGAVAVMVTAWG